jgi:propionyl-CoA carboxylase alpha chain
MGSKLSTSIFTPRTAELGKFLRTDDGLQNSGAIVAPISGLVRDIKVSEGDLVTKGQIIAVLEAMKMENLLIAQVDCKINKIHAKVGDSVGTGEVLVELD